MAVWPWTSRSWRTLLPDVGPALAPMVLAADGGSYAFLSAVAGACALASAGAILRVRQVR
jgi:hypothetical protein